MNGLRQSSKDRDGGPSTVKWPVSWETRLLRRVLLGSSAKLSAMAFLWHLRRHLYVQHSLHPTLAESRNRLCQTLPRPERCWAIPTGDQPSGEGLQTKAGMWLHSSRWRLPVSFDLDSHLFPNTPACHILNLQLPAYQSARWEILHSRPAWSTASEVS